MLIASVSTILFNANPLLRYDGYYMLSDYLEIPNLQMRSREYLLGLIKRHVFRIKPTQPLPPPLQRVQLLVYGILSTVYRIFIGVVIILMVTWTVPILGVLMALGGLVTWLVVPVVKLFKYLTIDPELHRKRGRGWAFTLAVATAVIVLVGFIRFPLSVYAQGVVEPEQKYVLHTLTPGWVEEIVAKDGQLLAEGDRIVVCKDPELDARIQQLRANIGEEEAKIRQLSVQDASQVELARKRRDTIQSQLDDALRQQEELTIKAPFAGALIAPELRHLQGRYMERGTEVGIVATMQNLRIKATIDQSDGERALHAKGAEVRLVGKPDVVLYPLPETIKVIPAAQRELPHPRLGAQGGGDIQTDPRDERGTKPLVPHFELRATVPNPEGDYFAGQGAAVRLIMNKEPLFKRWRDGFLRLVRSSSSGSKWM
jgi:putative peptide zinc metalloprotease protein